MDSLLRHHGLNNGPRFDISTRMKTRVETPLMEPRRAAQSFGSFGFSPSLDSGVRFRPLSRNSRDSRRALISPGLVYRK